jgi:hypothetical protein
MSLTRSWYARTHTRAHTRTHTHTHAHTAWLLATRAVTDPRVCRAQSGAAGVSSRVLRALAAGVSLSPSEDAAPLAQSTPTTRVPRVSLPLSIRSNGGAVRSNTIDGDDIGDAGEHADAALQSPLAAATGSPQFAPSAAFGDAEGLSSSPRLRSQSYTLPPTSSSAEPSTPRTPSSSLGLGQVARAIVNVLDDEEDADFLVPSSSGQSSGASPRGAPGSSDGGLARPENAAVEPVHPFGGRWATASSRMQAAGAGGAPHPPPARPASQNEHRHDDALQQYYTQRPAGTRVARRRIVSASGRLSSSSAAPQQQQQQHQLQQAQQPIEVAAASHAQQLVPQPQPSDEPIAASGTSMGLRPATAASRPRVPAVEGAFRPATAYGPTVELRRPAPSMLIGAGGGGRLVRVVMPTASRARDGGSVSLRGWMGAGAHRSAPLQNVAHARALLATVPDTRALGGAMPSAAEWDGWDAGVLTAPASTVAVTASAAPVTPRSASRMSAARGASLHRELVVSPVPTVNSPVCAPPAPSPRHASRYEDADALNMSSHSGRVRARTPGSTADNSYLYDDVPESQLMPLPGQNQNAILITPRRASDAARPPGEPAAGDAGGGAPSTGSAGGGDGGGADDTAGPLGDVDALHSPKRSADTAAGAGAGAVVPPLRLDSLREARAAPSPRDAVDADAPRSASSQTSSARATTPRSAGARSGAGRMHVHVSLPVASMPLGGATFVRGAALPIRVASPRGVPEARAQSAHGPALRSAIRAPQSAADAERHELRRRWAADLGALGEEVDRLRREARALVLADGQRERDEGAVRTAIERVIGRADELRLRLVALRDDLQALVEPQGSASGSDEAAEDWQIFARIQAGRCVCGRAHARVRAPLRLLLR